MRNKLRRSKAKSKGLGSSVQKTPTLFRKSQIALCVASLSMAAGANAAPTDATVVSGNVGFNQNGSQLDISNSDRAIINWRDFSIENGETVNFVQQNAQSAVLNRVTGGIASEILGDLSSNGRVFLINPNGVVIGEGARIETASFVASTLNISDDDFVNGDLNFRGDSGKIENHGYIATAPNGDVVLIAPSIENNGLIQADGGQILLAAGREVTLHSLVGGGISYRVSAPGDKALNIGELVAENGSVKVFADQIFNQGTITANRAHRNADGNIVLDADDNVNVSGEITVSGEGVDAGNIEILGDQVDLLGATIDASGEIGGEILIGGDFQGQGTVKNALNTNVDAATTITADAGTNGDGGRIIVWSDETTNAFARISARGGSETGDGGFVETSGKVTLNFGVPVDVSATNGEAGTWLLDPEDIIIGETEADAISTSLNGGSNVEVKTSDEGEGEGNISVNSPITKTEGEAAVTLTLDAHNRVDVNAPITTTAGPLNLTIKTGRQVAATTTPEENTGAPEEIANAPEENTEENDEPNQDSDQIPNDEAVESDDVAVTEEDDATDIETGEVNDNESNTEVVSQDGQDEESVDDAADVDDQPSDNTEEESIAAIEPEAATEESDADQQALDETHTTDATIADAPTDNQAPADPVADLEEATDVIETAQMDEVVDATESPVDDSAPIDPVATAPEVAVEETSPEVEQARDVATETPEIEQVADAEQAVTQNAIADSQDVQAPAVSSQDTNVADANAPTQVDVIANDASVPSTISADTSTDESPVSPAVVEQPSSESSDFIVLDNQQIVIAADIDTGGGSVSINAGENGDVVISASVDTADADQQNAGDVTLEGQRIALDLSLIHI